MSSAVRAADMDGRAVVCSPLEGCDTWQVVSELVARSIRRPSRAPGSLSSTLDAVSLQRSVVLPFPVRVLCSVAACQGRRVAPLRPAALEGSAPVRPWR